MAKLPQLTGREVVRRLKRLGFDEARQRGSHVVMKHEGTGATTMGEMGLTYNPDRKPLYNHSLKKMNLSLPGW